MRELVIRFREFHSCFERVPRNPQLTNGEKAAACSYRQIVRERLPAVLLNHYDRTKKSERALRSRPEEFRLGVLVSTYRRFSTRRQMELITHFAAPASTTVFQRHGIVKQSRKGAPLQRHAVILDPGEVFVDGQFVRSKTRRLTWKQF